MSLLVYESEMKKAGDFEDEVKEGTATAEERKLAETLIAASTTEDFDLGKYKDEYSARLARLVEGKSRKQRRVSADEEAPAVINLMEALRRSLHKAGHGRNGKRGHPAKTGRRHESRRKTG
jgi:non-homologous end joining protein Ku